MAEIDVLLKIQSLSDINNRIEIPVIELQQRLIAIKTYATGAIDMRRKQQEPQKEHNNGI